MEKDVNCIEFATPECIRNYHPRIFFWPLAPHISLLSTSKIATAEIPRREISGKFPFKSRVRLSQHDFVIICRLEQSLVCEGNFQPRPPLMPFATMIRTMFNVHCFEIQRTRDFPLLHSSVLLEGQAFADSHPLKSPWIHLLTYSA